MCNFLDLNRIWRWGIMSLVKYGVYKIWSSSIVLKAKMQGAEREGIDTTFSLSSNPITQQSEDKSWERRKGDSRGSTEGGQIQFTD